MNQGIIYLAINKINNKKYVGQTIKKLKYRIKSHIVKSKKAKIGFDRAIKKYGIKNFKWAILEQCSVDVLDDKEKYYIKQEKTYAGDHPKLGYNLTRGGITSFGASGKYHYLNRMGPKEKQLWIEKHRKGKNNPNYNNGDKISGTKHFLSRMRKNQKEVWLDKNLRGKNNYQSKMSKKELKDKCYINKMSKGEKEKWIKDNLIGDNNPYKKVSHLHRGKNSFMFGRKGSDHNCSKKYIITFPNNDELMIDGLAEFCRLFNKKVKTIKLNDCNLSRCAGGYVKKYKNFRCRHYSKKDADITKYSDKSFDIIVCRNNWTTEE